MNKRARFEEKRNFVVLWLLEFQFSTPRVICKAMGLVRENQGHFFSSLKKSGLFSFVRTPLINEEVLILNFQGKQYGAMLSPKAESYGMSSSRVASSTAIHSLCVQVALIERCSTAQPFTFQYERFIHDIEKHKRPDALMDLAGSVVALEVELTQKASKRIYLGYLDHIANMKAGLYSRVEYVFPSASLCAIYQGRFDAPEWPVFHRDKHGKVVRTLDAGEPVTANANSEAIRNRFSFVSEDLY
jgi:hypothetical protein